MGIINSVNSAIELADKAKIISDNLKNLELKEIIVDLKADLINVKDENNNLREENRKLKKQILHSSKREVVEKDGFVWKIIDNKEEGPFCPDCFDNKNELHKLEERDYHKEYRCDFCKQYFGRDLPEQQFMIR